MGVRGGVELGAPMFEQTTAAARDLIDLDVGMNEQQLLGENW